MRPITLASIVLGSFVLAAAASAQVHPPENVLLLKHLDRGENYSGNWGYTSPGGVELAISGTASGTTFIDATDPANATEVAFIPAPSSTWREIATYGQYAYIVTEASGAALQVVSLANPLQPTLVATLNPPAFFYSTAHEIKIDQTTGYCYVCGTNGTPGRGLVILDLNANPTNPPMRGNWNVNYVHDISIQNGKAYCASIYDGIVYVLDVTQAGTPPIIAQWTYPTGFTHNTWPSDDGRYLVTTDENTGGHLRMWNIQNLPQAPSQTDEWLSPTGALVHNAYLRGNICYMSHYRDGLRVVDATDPSNLQAVGWYDTHPQDGGGFNGAWGCYCFAADPSIAYISDIESGTYILQFSTMIGTLAGTVRDAVSQQPIAGATVDVVGANVTRTTNAQGTYSAPLAAGNYTVNCTAFGYQPASSPVTITANQTTTRDFDLNPVPSGSLTGVVQSQTLAPIAGASVVIEGTPLATSTNASGVYSFALVPAGSYDVTASKFGYSIQTVPVTIVAAQQATRDFTLRAALFAADMESSPGAWTVSGNATTGQWVRVDPIGSGGGLVQPEDDHTPAPGVMCWVTGQGTVGGAIGEADVDNGNTILTTHIFDLTSLVDPILDYWRWFVNNANGNADDPWVVEVSSNGGTSWVAIENTLQTQAFWRQITVRVSDFVTPNSQFRVRFTARDLNPGSIVEAGVDDFQIYDGAGSVAVGDPGAVAAAGPALLGNFPNPFNPATAIRFNLAAPAPVRLRIFDAAGRTVRVLADGPAAAGAQAVVWDGRNDEARPVASGVYYYRLETAGFSESKSMVLAK